MSGAGEGLVFLFSLPRSGSTLTQRLVGAHPQVVTASEPWVLLPLLYALRDRGVYSEYGHRMAALAMQDFLGTLPAGRAAYVDGVRALASELYAQARGDRTYFLDKTPRYHLVVDEILEMFPEAKAIFLWRQPLAVAASIIDSFADGRWNIDKYAVDLFEGVDALLAAQARQGARALVVRYEDIVADPSAQARRIFDYLGLPAVDAAGAFRDVGLHGRMGDRRGAGYDAVSAEPLSRWTATLANPLRRRWASRYLRWLGDRVEAMGYDAAALRAELDAAPRSARRLGADIRRMALGYAYWRVADRLTASPPRPIGGGPRHQSSSP